MVDLAGGQYFALNEVGARMWSLLIAGKTPAEVGTALVGEYETGQEEIVGDCANLVDELLRRGLLIVRDP
jgi:hypothetical protein